MPEIQDWNQFKGAQYSLYNHLSEQAYVLLDARTSEINKLNSLADWQQRQQWLKKKLLEVVGPFPEKRTDNLK